MTEQQGTVPKSRVVTLTLGEEDPYRQAIEAVLVEFQKRKLVRRAPTQVGLVPSEQWRAAKGVTATQLLEELRAAEHEHARRNAAALGVATNDAHGLVRYADRPARLVCLYCGNDEDFEGTDERMVGSQSFHVEGGDESSADFESYETEIGDYTAIDCAACSRNVWCEWRPGVGDFRVLGMALATAGNPPAEQAVFDHLLDYFGLREAYHGQ